jgi:hypothetical protein
MLHAWASMVFFSCSLSFSELSSNLGGKTSKKFIEDGFFV